MPEGASWRMLLAVACLGGIGFTMSLFVDSLAFSDVALIDRGKDCHPDGLGCSSRIGYLINMDLR